MGLDDITLSSTLVVEEFWISQRVVLAVEQKHTIHHITHAVEEFWISMVAVLAVVQGLIIHITVVAAMDDFVKSNCLFTYGFFMNEI